MGRETGRERADVLREPRRANDSVATPWPQSGRNHAQRRSSKLDCFFISKFWFENKYACRVRKRRPESGHEVYFPSGFESW